LIMLQPNTHIQISEMNGLRQTVCLLLELPKFLVNLKSVTKMAVCFS